MDEVRSLVSWILIIGTLLMLVFVPIACMDSVDAGEIVVVQEISGALSVRKQPGWFWVGFSKTTEYPKTQQFEFSGPEVTEEGTPVPPAEGQSQVPDNTVSVRFNDNGKGRIGGSLTWDMPESEKNIIELHTKFRGPDAIEANLIKPALVKAVYNAGPMMSSRESAGERRNELLELIRDQAIRGVYKVETRSESVEDLFAEKIETVEFRDVPVLDAAGVPTLNADSTPRMEKKPFKVMKHPTKMQQITVPQLDARGNIEVAEESTITRFDLKVYNFTISQINYDSRVHAQIKAQQDAIMAIQTARANAQRAQQDALTAKEIGAATVAKATAEENEKKIRQVVQAQARAEVAEQQLNEARLLAQAVTVKADADAAAKRKLMEADGALAPKLDAWVRVNQAYAAQMGLQRWVPDVVFGGDARSTNGASAAQDFIQMMTMQTARELGVNTNIR